jgi:hypothetical protein
MRRRSDSASTSAERLAASAIACRWLIGPPIELLQSVVVANEARQRAAKLRMAQMRTAVRITPVLGGVLVATPTSRSHSMTGHQRTRGGVCLVLGCVRKAACACQPAESRSHDRVSFLVQRFEGMGYTGQVAQSHGGMHYTERDQQVERFRRPVDDGGARLLVCTDAAGEGINLQFCWIMINYDIPWNPARLEQRMGRIHRYGQQHDPVIILNLIAPDTREGRVLKTLLDKLERIREELKSDKVFDVIGRVFAGVSIKQYMEMAVADGQADGAIRELEHVLTKEQVEAIAARERSLYGTGGDVAQELPRLRDDAERELYRRLLPGYVRQYVELAAPLLDLEIDGDAGQCFSLKPLKRTAADSLLQTVETYPEAARNCLTFIRPKPGMNGIWIHPGEPVFEAFRQLVHERLGREGLRGAIFVDPSAERPYLFHVAIVSVVRDADPDLEDLAHEEVLECRLVGIKQFEGAEVVVTPVEHLLLLRAGRGLPASAQRLAIAATDLTDQARAYLVERVARERALERRSALTATLPERESFIERGFDYQAAELAAARAKQSEKARAGNLAAQRELDRIKQQQKLLAQRKAESLAVLRREPELIRPCKVEFVAHALVVPSADPADEKELQRKTDEVAMALAWAYEESSGAIVQDVHTPAMALAAGLNEHPGFDLLSTRLSERRSIEVKGRAGVGPIEVSDNEWGRACNLRDKYWLYVVFDCATPSPRLVRVQYPFGSLLANPQDPPGRLVGISVEDVKAYVNFVKETVGITHEDELVQMLAILATKVHPLALGNVERFISQSRMIARKLLNTHMDNVSERDIEDIVESLASRLYFHGHPINRAEAERELKLKIARDVPTDLENALWCLYADYENEFRNREPFQPWVELASQLQPWALPAAGQSPQPQLATQTSALPLTIVESRTLSSLQVVTKRFTLIAQIGQPDQRRDETVALAWTRTPAPAQPPAH